MKLSSAIVLLSSVASAVALKASPKLLQSARKLDQNAESEYAFLNNYHMKLIECKSGETYVSPVNGVTEYSSVVFRMCDTDCDNDSTYGCTEKYGDYVIGLNTFAQEYLEQKRDEMQGDDDVNDWKYEKFGECQAWEMDKDTQMYDENGEALTFYVGPACSEDEKSVRLAMFTDAYCQTLSETVTFEDISNGVSLPYSSGGLIGYGCESCYGANDKGEYELAEMCSNLYMYAGKCESQMESTHYTGKQEASCEYITSLMPASASSSKAGAAIGWTIFALVIVGAAAFGYMHMKKKQDDKRAGLMS